MRKEPRRAGIIKNVPILVDGPNYINRMIDLEIDSVHIARQLSLEGLMGFVSQRLGDVRFVSGRCASVEFVCSKKRFGPEAKKFTEDRQRTMLDRFRGETGVYVDVVDIPGSSEKGVDATIAGKMEDYARTADAMVLVSEDRDFIPTLRRLRSKTKVVVVGLRDEFPVELRNEAYASLLIRRDYQALFRYAYPKFSVKEFDERKCAQLYSEADDRTFNQVRVTKSGYVYVFRDAVGSNELHGVQFRFETFSAYNEYVGPKAASDGKYISNETNEILLGWKRGFEGYADAPIEALLS